MSESTEKPLKAPTFSINFMPLVFAAAFKASSDIRHYLNGILIEPCESGGVRLIATNGHYLGAIHDPNGQASRKFIYKPDAETLRIARAYMHKSIVLADEGDAHPAHGVMSDGIRTKCMYSGDELYVTPLPRVADPFGTPHWEIDTEFVNWKRAIPEALFGQPVSRVGYVNAAYESAITSALSMLAIKGKNQKSVYVHASQRDANESILYTPAFSTEYEALAVLMPIRHDEGFESKRPDWLGEPYKSPAA